MGDHEAESHDFIGDSRVFGKIKKRSPMTGWRFFVWSFVPFWGDSSHTPKYQEYTSGFPFWEDLQTL